jgi:hypothetical protein
MPVLCATVRWKLVSGARVFIEPTVHEQFVQDFGLNMLNTLTAKSLRVAAHRRRIHVFDERGGVIGGQEHIIQRYRNMTTGVFHSRTRKVVGVRYRCDPGGLNVPAMGAFHTHPALYDDDPERVRRRIDRLLWMSELDIEAFRQQYRIFGYQWHFIGCVDIACFHIRDIQSGTMAPRYILRYPHLERLMQRLRPEIMHFDSVLRNAPQNGRGDSGRHSLHSLLIEMTPSSQEPTAHIQGLESEAVIQLSRRVAQECQLRGLSRRSIDRDLAHLLSSERSSIRCAGDNLSTFTLEIRKSFDRLGSLH